MNQPSFSAAERNQIVNRTHRVIRERAAFMQQRRSHTRSLWIPLAICSALLVSIFYAVWEMLAQYDITPTGIPDSNYQILFLLLWSLPITAAVIGLVWLQRSRRRGRDEAR